MKTVVTILLLAALAGCAHPHKQGLSDFSIRDIEQLSFADAYALWRQETMNLPPDQTSWLTASSTDPRTGGFTPGKLPVLECRLGREAHLHVSFLAEQLQTNADVHRILEASPRLCAEHDIHSKAQVEWVAEGQYRHRNTDGWIPQVQQKLWLEAFNKARLQSPDGPANASQADSFRDEFSVGGGWLPSLTSPR
jgi:hypothetical protein